MRGEIYIRWWYFCSPHEVVDPSMALLPTAELHIPELGLTIDFNRKMFRKESEPRPPEDDEKLEKVGEVEIDPSDAQLFQKCFEHYLELKNLIRKYWERAMEREVAVDLKYWEKRGRECLESSIKREFEDWRELSEVVCNLVERGLMELREAKTEKTLREKIEELNKLIGGDLAPAEMLVRKAERTLNLRYRGNLPFYFRLSYEPGTIGIWVGLLGGSCYVAEAKCGKLKA